MNPLDEHELTEIRGGMAPTPPRPTPLSGGIDWAERWYWELTH